MLLPYFSLCWMLSRLTIAIVLSILMLAYDSLAQTPPQPALASYLANIDLMGNTALQPGPLLEDDPFSQWAQDAKSKLSDLGFRYTFQHGHGLAFSLNEVRPNSSHNLGYSSFQLYAKQLVFNASPSEPAGWISLKVEGGGGLGTNLRKVNPATELGTLAQPFGLLSPVEGLYLDELAWQQSFADGKVVALIGQLDQTNYLDTNVYANSQFTQFLNSALINSMVLPISTGGLGMNLQWQPDDNYYLILGVGQNHSIASRTPLNGIKTDNVSYMFEFGYTPANFLGLGAGTYRIQPFVATVNGINQGGIGLNINQQLGSHWGFFGRFGVGGATVTNINGAATQIATGLVLQQPLKVAGLSAQDSNDFLGFGFVWSQPSKSQRPAAHFNEYALELLYVFQLTATATLNPNVQVFVDPVGNPKVNSDFIFQLPLVISW